jgi:hypothetical protein
VKQQISIKDIKKNIHNYIKPIIYCHPENLKLLKDTTSEPADTHFRHYPFGYDYGIEIIQDKHLPRYARVWKFPQTPFVEYEKSDEVWAIPIGFGRWVETEDPVYYIIDRNVFYSYNPTIWKTPISIVLGNLS